MTGLSPREETFAKALRGEVVFVNDLGHTFDPPIFGVTHGEDETPAEWARRYHEWRDAISECGSRAFDRAFQKALR